MRLLGAGPAPWTVRHIQTHRNRTNTHKHIQGSNESWGNGSTNGEEMTQLSGEEAEVFVCVCMYVGQMVRSGGWGIVHLLLRIWAHLCDACDVRWVIGWGHHPPVVAGERHPLHSTALHVQCVGLWWVLVGSGGLVGLEGTP